MTGDESPRCTKRPYGSVEAVRRAHRRASWRVRAYWCEDCRAYHGTNHEKHRDHYEYEDTRRR
jgi:hypothetical protein